MFPAAILQHPFFDKDADDAVNFGSMGAVIGHEMTVIVFSITCSVGMHTNLLFTIFILLFTHLLPQHGFDDKGRKFDYSGTSVLLT